MDIRKAFDSVSHKILLQKLYHYGIRGLAHKLLQSCCNDAKLQLFFNSINIGVPQGSILGPPLFLLYVNDKPNATFCNPRLFADDTCLIVRNSTLSGLEHEYNREMQKLHK